MSKEIRITDNFMFATVMQKESICRPFIERMLEMQCDDRKDLPLRTRYYQGLQNISFLDKGNFYEDLPESYILFICLFDLFGKGLPVYTFENVCREDTSVSFNEKCRKVFYNVNAWEKETSPERRVLLEYFYGCKASDELTKAIEEQVHFTRNLREWRKEHMTLEQEIQLQSRYAYDEGLIQGKEQGAHDKAVEAAKSAIALGLTIEQIAKITGLDAEEISRLTN